MILPKFSVNRPIFTTMVTLIVIIVVSVSLSRLRIDLLPNIELPTLSVRTHYEGASPEVVERLVTQILEEIIANIIKHGYDNSPEQPIDLAIEMEVGRLMMTVEDEGKPFNPLELAVRIKAILKRAGTSTASETIQELSVGMMKLDLRRKELSINDKAVSITPAEMRVIEQLLRHPGEVLSRSQLTALALDREIEAYDRSIDTLISKLRRKLSTAGISRDCIRGLRGHGYVLDTDSLESN